MLQRILAVCLVVFCGQLFAQDCSTGQCRTPVRSALRVAAKPVVNTVEFLQNRQPVRSGLRAMFTSPQPQQYVESFVVGGYDYDGCVISSISHPSESSTPSSEVDSLSFRKRKASREAILEAANKAHDACTINSDELRAIRLACMSPRMLAKIEDLIIEKAQNSGAYTFALKANGEVDKAAINWEAIGDFILKIAPIIFKLIELFAVLEQANPNQTSVAFADHSPNFVASMGFSGC